MKIVTRQDGFLRSVEMDKFTNSQTELTGISLFTGCGGFDVGLARAGFKIRVMVEFDKTCCETLHSNFHMEGIMKRSYLKELSKKELKRHKKYLKKLDWYHKPEPVILQKDITTTTTKEILDAGNLQIGEATLVFGGSPCQGFSTAGKRSVDDPRNKLIYEFWRVVNEAMPRMFVFENVPGMVYGKNHKLIMEFCDTFASSGYNVSWDILNAADFGVPQNRKRVFIIGKRIDATTLFNNRIQYHIAVGLGRVEHPNWFIKKHSLKANEQSTLSGDHYG